MTVEIDFERSTINDGDGVGGWLVLHDPDKDEDYASWPFYAADYDGDRVDMHWTWENPDAPLEDITLSPSLVLEQDDPNTFHIFVRDGEIEHCGDCQCGCNTNT